MATIYANKLRIPGMLAILPVLISCRIGGLAATSDTIVVPREVPVGTLVPTNRLSNSKEEIVLMVVGDCSSCSSQVLNLKRHSHEIHRFVVTIHSELINSLKKEWPSATVVYDAKRTLLPEYCYTLTPQMFLVKDERILDGAVGAVECESKWDEWNK
jgi:hypothetical protein